ncbi:hypothetical protein SCWH03_11420 [Streptomyces pacificus]|uniref:Uncharacterized protein n=1 Tax=Streptomyces pacificus TaxID=2705029 RepID=A0A6A0AQJ7_9ACTN|nr:hypothetical protein SCWH03_11420 [Streptomyces pacificus]
MTPSGPQTRRRTLLPGPPALPGPRTRPALPSGPGAPSTPGAPGTHSGIPALDASPRARPPRAPRPRLPKRPTMGNEVRAYLPWGKEDDPWLLSRRRTRPPVERAPPEAPAPPATCRSPSTA